MLILEVTQRYFQNAENKPTGLQKDASYNGYILGNGSDTIGSSGCLLTAYTRIANAANATDGGKTFSPGDSNEVGIANSRFEKGSSGLKRDPSSLLSDLTGKKFSYSEKEVAIGPKSQSSLAKIVKELGNDKTATYGIVGQLSNGHYININGVDADGNLEISDTFHYNTGGGNRTIKDYNGDNVYVMQLRIVKVED
jgi:hypothetical protein